MDDQAAKTSEAAEPVEKKRRGRPPKYNSAQPNWVRSERARKKKNTAEREMATMSLILRTFLESLGDHLSVNMVFREGIARAKDIGDADFVKEFLPGIEGALERASSRGPASVEHWYHAHEQEVRSFVSSRKDFDEADDDMLDDDALLLKRAKARVQKCREELHKVLERKHKASISEKIVEKMSAAERVKNKEFVASSAKAASEVPAAEYEAQAHLGEAYEDYETLRQSLAAKKS